MKKNTYNRSVAELLEMMSVSELFITPKKMDSLDDILVHMLTYTHRFDTIVLEGVCHDGILGAFKTRSTDSDYLYTLELFKCGSISLGTSETTPEELRGLSFDQLPYDVKRKINNHNVWVIELIKEVTTNEKEGI